MLGHVLLRYNPRGVPTPSITVIPSCVGHHIAVSSDVAFFGDTKVGILLSLFFVFKGTELKKKTIL